MKSINKIELIGEVIEKRMYEKSGYIGLRLDVGERHEVFAKSFYLGMSAKLNAEVSKGDKVKIMGFVKCMEFISPDTGEKRHLSQVSMLQAEKVEAEQESFIRWELEGRLLEPIYAYTGSGWMKGKFVLIGTLTNGDEKPYTVILTDEELAKRMERETEPGQILRVRGKLGKYIAKGDAGEKIWRPCMYMTEDITNAIQD